MIDRIKLKIRTILHYIAYNKLYSNGVIVYGVPSILYPEKIFLGKNVRINDRVFLHGIGGINIGDNTTLSYGVSVITESYDLSSYDQYIERCHRSQPIKIGENVWLGAYSIVLPGVSIASNVIVGAGAVVTKDLQDEYCIYAGNPAKLIKRM